MIRNVLMIYVLSMMLLVAGSFADDVENQIPREVGTNKSIETPTLDPSLDKKAPAPLAGNCRDLCGDGECQEIVCQAEGCPCEESSSSCPQDCP